jgi:hypothetical protein
LVLRVSPRKMTRALLVVLALLAIAHVACRYAVHYRGYADPYHICQMFDLTNELNLPTYFSSLLLLLCSALLALIARLKKESDDPWRRGWAALSIIFLYLSVDESVCIHERIGHCFKLATHGIFHQFHWAIPFSMLVIVFSLAFLRFLFSLPRSTRLWFVAAGIVYVTGALVLESVDSLVWQLAGKSTILHGLETFAEEILEMLGAAMFALASYVSTYIGDFKVQFDGRRPHSDWAIPAEDPGETCRVA